MNYQLEDLEEELWVPLYGYEDFYVISSFARVKHRYREISANCNGFLQKRIFESKMVAQYIRSGYLAISATDINGIRKSSSVHRLMLLSFGVPNPENKTQVNHKDGDKLNNLLSNLEWCTPSQNNIHALLTNLRVMPKGELSCGSKLKEYQVIEIRNSTCKTGIELASEYGVAKSTISSIRNRKSWKHI